jgi:hypothetical protein
MLRSMELDTPRKIAKALGGVSSLAELTGTSYANAHSWVARGWFARNTYQAIKTELDRRGLVAPAELWRMK